MRKLCAAKETAPRSSNSEFDNAFTAQIITSRKLESGSKN